MTHFSELKKLRNMLFLWMLLKKIRISNFEMWMPFLLLSQKKSPVPGKSSYIKIMLYKGTRFECAECDASFPVLQSLNYHISVVHEGKRYDCSLCEAKFTALHSLDRHMTRKHEENSNSVQKGEKKFPKE